MRHARAEDLEPLTDLLARVRSIDGLTERSPGTFYRGPQAFLHFHADPAGPFADLKIDGEFVRFRARTQREQRSVAAAARRAARAGAR